MTIELRRYDTLRATFPDTDAVGAFGAFWDELLSSSWDPEARWHGWTLTLPGRRPVVFDRDALGTATLYALMERRKEPGFAAAMARLHAAAPDDDSIDATPFLAIAPRLDEIAPVLAAVRHALAVTAPLRHLGLSSEPLPRPADAGFTVTTHSGAYANGAGCMTLFAEWELEVYAPMRVRILVSASDEEGRATDWSIDVVHDALTPVGPLLDALRAKGFYPHGKPATLPPA